MNEAEMFNELRQATEAFKLAEGETSHARSRECAALNRLNRAQQAITNLTLELKKVAPRDSDWRRSEIRGLPTG